MARPTHLPNTHTTLYHTAEENDKPREQLLGFPKIPTPKDLELNYKGTCNQKVTLSQLNDADVSLAWLCERMELL